MQPFCAYSKGLGFVFCSFFVWKSAYSFKAFYLNTLPSKGIFFLFVPSTQKFKAFSTFINSLSRAMAVTSAVIQACNPYALSISLLKIDG